jgi:hypothetical protein
MEIYLRKFQLFSVLDFCGELVRPFLHTTTWSSLHVFFFYQRSNNIVFAPARKQMSDDVSVSEKNVFVAAGPSIE